MSKRGKPVTQAIRTERRLRAEKMLEEYHQKYPTTQDKLNALPPTGATRQRQRLLAKLAEEQKVSAATEQTTNKNKKEGK
jgi:hypothetical protein